VPLLLPKQITSGMGGCRTAILRRDAHCSAIYSAAAAHLQVSGVSRPTGASEVPSVLCFENDGCFTGKFLSHSSSLTSTLLKSYGLGPYMGSYGPT
jgi:hypothetical protein